jgi:hypothetical protein
MDTPDISHIHSRFPSGLFFLQEQPDDGGIAFFHSSEKSSCPLAVGPIDIYLVMRKQKPDAVDYRRSRSLMQCCSLRILTRSIHIDSSIFQE